MPSQPAKSPKQNKCCRSPTSEDEEETSSSKQKLGYKALPWVARDEIDPPSLSPILKITHTQEDSRAFGELCLQPQAYQVLPLNNPRCLQFPNSEWSNLIASRAINLNCVLAGQYMISHDERHTERISDLEFIVGSDKPAKTVNEHSKWVMAWDTMFQATLFIFPHRASELTDYGTHIKGLFAALPSFVHE